MQPVLLVHGINDSGKTFSRMSRALVEAGAPEVLAIDLRPNNGRASLVELAKQVDGFARELLARTGAATLDLVGFSMGALVSRYWLQRLGGRDRTRRFISISGPHAGTWLARFSSRTGIREMRPGSAFIRNLESDPDPFGSVEVHVLFTPLDLMILPAKGSLLAHARTSKAIPVVLHPLMLSDQRVLKETTALLSAA